MKAQAESRQTLVLGVYAREFPGGLLKLHPAFAEKPFMDWLEGDNLCYCDTIGALGGEQLLNHDKVRCMKVSTGRTSQAFVRLSEKVLANIENFLA